MRVESLDAREYYIKEANQQNWSLRQFERNINTFYYHRLLSSKDKQEALQDSTSLEKSTPADIIKDPYVFEFLNIPQPVNALEMETENALIQNLQQFLLELGERIFIYRQAVSYQYRNFSFLY